MTPEPLRRMWNGPLWRWTALALGIVLTALALLLALALSALTGADANALALLCVLAPLLVASLFGAGMLDWLAGLQTSNYERPEPPKRPGLSGRRARLAPQEQQAPQPKTAEDERRDRTTIRAALVALPLLIAFIVLLFS